MKTTAYTQAEEVKAIILLVVLTLAFLVSKAQNDLPTQPTLESFTASINNPEYGLMAVGDSDAGNAEGQLLTDLKTMMSNGAYWSDDNNENEFEEQHLSQMLTDWMQNGLYWEENQQPKFEFDNTIAENEMNNN
jgi:hypothetical protein